MKLARNSLAIAVSVTLLASTSARPRIAGDDLDALLEAREIPVTIDSFNRAATDIKIAKYVPLAGGVNRLYHFREPTPVDALPTIRMNRDTLYRAAVIDISKGATLTLPDAGDRCMSAMVVNQDHYVNAVFHGGDSYALDIDTLDTPYVIIYMRTLVDASDPQDVAEVNALQDQIRIEAAFAQPFILPPHDEEDYEGLVRAILGLVPYIPGSSRVFGAKDEVDPLRHFRGTAIGWGGLPEAEAFYDGVDPQLPVGEYRIEVPADVPVGAFWSVRLYNASGFFEPNAIGSHVIKSVMGERNDDGSMTVHLGGCDDGRVNCLPLMEGWNYTVRMYQPGEEILNGAWTFPRVETVN